MDAATLLDFYTHDLSNLPLETRSLMKRLQQMDIEYDKILKSIENAESQLQKYIKQHGSSIRHPKEDLILDEITQNYERAKQLQDDKILLTNTALLNITKHTNNFQRDIRKLIESGAIENWDVQEDGDDDVEMSANGLFVQPSATSVKPSRSNSNINELANKLNNAAIEMKTSSSRIKKSRDRTPLDENVTSREHTPRRRDISNGTTVVKGPRRPMGVNSSSSASNNNHNNNGSDNKNGNGNSNSNGDDDELYCFCQQVSYGEMVACDSPTCKYEWFHYDCVGLKEPPVGVWYCPVCRKDSKNVNNKREKKKKM